MEGLGMIPESTQFNDYLVSDSVVNWKEQVVLDKALKLTKGLSDDIAKAQCLWTMAISIPHIKVM